jgi:hypothetical protein
MSLYRMTNVPVKDDRLSIRVEVKDEHVILWQVRANDPENDEYAWRIAEVFIGDHMFAPEKRDMLRDKIGNDIVTALNRGIELGYAKAQADIRQALGIRP